MLRQKRPQNLNGHPNDGWSRTFSFSYMASGLRGKFRQRNKLGKPRKSVFFFKRKRPKGDERVALGRFHETVGGRPQSYENFGNSEIWPLDWNCHTTEFYIVKYRSIQVPSIRPDIQRGITAVNGWNEKVHWKSY